MNHLVKIRMSLLTIAAVLTVAYVIINVWTVDYNDIVLLSNADQTQGKRPANPFFSSLGILLFTSIMAYCAVYIFSLKKAKNDLQNEVKKLSVAMEQSHDAVMIVDPDRKIEYINSAFTKNTGYQLEEIAGKSALILRFENDTENIYTTLWKTVLQGKTWSGELRKKRKNSESYWAFESISPILDKNNNVTHFLSTHRDVTEQHVLNEQLNFHASHDALTGLVNRREFEQRAEQLLSSVAQNKGQHALCFMDLDQFKVVNDTCGHAAGDALLRQLGNTLKNTMRERDLLARLGGDEFGVLIEHCSIENAYEIAVMLQKVIQNYQFCWQGKNFKVGVSIGLIAITERITDLSELLKNADASCYIAKQTGRNRVHVYAENDAEIAKHQGQIQWVSRINNALENDHFSLYAQVIVPLDESSEDNNGTHYELLVRMQDREGETVPPDAFLPTAERYNIIVSIDRWVITHAFNLLLAHPDFLSQSNFISINLSGQSLTKKDFLPFVLAEFSEKNIPAEKICFEITEMTAISDIHTATIFIEEMKKLGCQFALDDFGSGGLASFSYLKTLPIDYLKIDGMFVKDMLTESIEFAMVKSINEIGHVMGVKTIAEFVENDETKEMLTTLGVNYAQGYNIGRAQPFSELL